MQVPNHVSLGDSDSLCTHDNHDHYVYGSFGLNGDQCIVDCTDNSHRIQSYASDPLNDPLVGQAILAHNSVKKSGVPNYLGCKVQVHSGLNCAKFDSYLISYHDKMVCQLNRYGWPVNHNGSPIGGSAVDNHKGATLYPEVMDNYILTETSLYSTIGPFLTNPFSESSLAFSPLNSVPKKESSDRRVIMDLSFPRGSSVNDGIDKSTYLGADIEFTLPGVDDLIQLIHLKGRGALLYKRDLKRAYRQIPVDPGDYNLLAFTWRDHIYIDRVLAMGLRSASYCCQRFTNAIAYIMEMKGFRVVNYQDDFAGAENGIVAKTAFEEFGILLKELGVQESVPKACGPETRMVFLGVTFDTVTMTIEVTPERVVETLNEVENWLSKFDCVKKELQSLLGKLHFVCKCVRQGRVFVSRLLNFLREIPETGSAIITQDVKGDLKWFKVFLPSYNGISMMPPLEWSDPDDVLACDACLVGCGAVCGNLYFHAKFPDGVSELQLHISALEMLTLVTACKVFATHLRGSRIRVHCDNMATVDVVNSGKTRDRFMQACLRELCFITAQHEFEVQVTHISGTMNRLPDLLSRWDIDETASVQFGEITHTLEMIEIAISDSSFAFEHNW